MFFSEFCLYNKQKNTWVLGNTRFFLVLNMISHSFAALTREISCSTREINLVCAFFKHSSVVGQNCQRAHFLCSPPRIVCDVEGVSRLSQARVS